MTTFDRDPLFDPRISDWLQDDPDRSPDIVLETVTAAFRSIPQRRAARVPWRFPTMSMPTRVAALVAVGALVIAGMLVVTGSGGRPEPVPTAPAQVATSASPTSSTVALDLPARFSSPQYGYTMAVAPDWDITPAKLTWSGPDNNPIDTDTISFPDGGGITAGSEAFRPGQTYAQWQNEFQPPSLIGGCHGTGPDAWPPIQVGDHAGGWQQMCGGNGEAVVQDGGRAYVFTFSPGSGIGAVTFDEFKQILGTVTFDPTAVPSAPPPPTLGKDFTSKRYGYSLSHPSEFTVSQAGKAVSGFVPDPTGPEVDAISSDSARLVVWSDALASGQTFDAWAKAYCAARRTEWTQPCDGAPANWREIPLASGTAYLMVDGDSAGTYLHDESRLFVATATQGDRAYAITMDGDLDEDLFVAILASMQLDPASAK